MHADKCMTQLILHSLLEMSDWGSQAFITVVISGVNSQEFCLCIKLFKQFFVLAYLCGTLHPCDCGPSYLVLGLCRGLTKCSLVILTLQWKEIP